MSGSNPSWDYGYVPTAGEWNQWWSKKQDYSPFLQQIVNQGGAPSYRPPAEWEPIDASGGTLAFTGVSAEYAVVGNIVLASCQLIYPTNSSTLAAAISGLPVAVPNQGYANIPNVLFVNGGSVLCITTVQNSGSADIYNLAGTQVANSILSGKTISFALAYPAS
jgi:hypothetical protein